MEKHHEHSYHFKKDGSEEIVFYDAQKRVGKNIMIGHVDDETAEWIFEHVKKITVLKKPISWIVDIRKLKTATRNARNIMKQMNQIRGIHKIAFIGGSPFGRAVTNFIVAAAGKKEIKHVASEKDAILWIHE